MLHLWFDSIQVTIDDDELRILGRKDNRAADGDGFEFVIRAIAVPEPSCEMLCMIGLFQLARMTCRLRQNCPNA